jgi:hypothetical protein
MKGYVMNTSTIWTHAMKRSVGPGAKIPLDELFEEYGVKHGLQEGKEFVEWLKNVKLKDTKKWKITLEEDVQTADPTITNSEVEKPAHKVSAGVAPLVKSKMTVKEVVNMSVRTAREELPKVHDLNLLKYALQEANQLAGKDSLCKIIRKRIRDLQIAR